MACQADFELGCYHNLRCLMVNYLVLVRLQGRNQKWLDRMPTQTVPNFATNILIFFLNPHIFNTKNKNIFLR